MKRSGKNEFTHFFLTLCHFKVTYIRLRQILRMLGYNLGRRLNTNFYNQDTYPL